VHLKVSNYRDTNISSAQNIVENNVEIAVSYNNIRYKVRQIHLQRVSRLDQEYLPQSRQSSNRTSYNNLQKRFSSFYSHQRLIRLFSWAYHDLMLELWSFSSSFFLSYQVSISHSREHNDFKFARYSNFLCPKCCRKARGNIVFMIKHSLQNKTNLSSRCASSRMSAAHLMQPTKRGITAYICVGGKRYWTCLQRYTNRQSIQHDQSMRSCDISNRQTFDGGIA